MTTGLRVWFGLLIVACVLASCASPNAKSGTPAQGGSSSPTTTLGALLNPSGPVEITYRWTGPRTGNPSGPGIVVWRIDGDTARWDSVWDAAARSEGRFIVTKRTPNDVLTFGCEWQRTGGDTSSKLRADCGPSGGSTTLADFELSQALPLLSDRVLVPDGSRTILNQVVSCYKERSDLKEQLCADSGGRVLYFSYHDGSGSDEVVVLEATAMTNEVEPFDWPTGALATPTGPHPDTRPESDLQLPEQIQVGH